MSLSALSSELDALIIGYLNKTDLWALSQTSKYYRENAEPSLHAHLSFGVEDHVSVKMFVLAILKRPELAKYIKSVEVVPPYEGWTSRPEGDGDETEEEEYDDLDEHAQAQEELRQQRKRDMKQLESRLEDESCQFVSEVEQLVNATWPNIHKHLRDDWLFVFKRASMDASLGLILTLAHNIERVEVQLSFQKDIVLVPYLLSYYQPENTESVNAIQPLQKLKKVIVNGAKMLHLYDDYMMFRVPYAQKAESLCVRHLGIYNFEFPVPKPDDDMLRARIRHSEEFPFHRMPQHFTPTLRELDLYRVEMNPDEVIFYLSTGFFKSLQILRLAKMRLAGRWYSARSDYDEVAQTLAEHTPDLHTLELSVWWDERITWFRTPTDPEGAAYPFTSLKDLKKLTELSMDLGFLFDIGSDEEPSAQSQLLSLPSKLPQGIKHVVLTSFEPRFLLELADAELLGVEIDNVLGYLSAESPSLQELKLETYRDLVTTFERALGKISKKAADYGLRFIMFMVDEGAKTSRRIGGSDSM